MLTSQVYREDQDDAYNIQAQGVARGSVLWVKGSQEARRVGSIDTSQNSS